MRKELLTTDELAERWHLNPSTLERWRNLQIGPTYIKLMEGTGRVLYRVEDILNYEENNKRNFLEEVKKTDQQYQRRDGKR